MSFVPAPQVAPAKNAPPSSVAPGTAAPAAAPASGEAPEVADGALRCAAFVCLSGGLAGSPLQSSFDMPCGPAYYLNTLSALLGGAMPLLLGFASPASSTQMAYHVYVNIAQPTAHLSSLPIAHYYYYSPPRCSAPHIQPSLSSSSVPSTSTGSTRAP